jgi:hypothetical protein
MKKRYLGCLLLLNLSLSAQNKPDKTGSFYGFWGYNRSVYANSDILFQGPGYDFTLANVMAKDAPTPLHEIKKYINPALFSIPQFNFHFGYFLKDNLSLSLGWDHMKYVMVNNQQVPISGVIASRISSPAQAVNPLYVGTFTNKNFQVSSSDFLTFEHTDGFNYASLELEHYRPLWGKGNRSLDWINGIGLGLVVPRSDVRLFTLGKNHFWNVAGAGGSLKSGLRFHMSKHVFFEALVKTGYTRLWDIRTTGRAVDHAEQVILFGEFSGAMGFVFGHKK